MQPKESFSIPNQEESTLPITYLETMQVTDGVTCDVCSHPDTEERDLGIITIQPGQKTPLQRVIDGEETIEGYLSGKGRLIITHKDESQSILEVDSSAVGFCHSVEIGELMQWQADDNEELQVFEVCFPPYQDGRFEEVNEQNNALSRKDN